MECGYTGCLGCMVTLDGWSVLMHWLVGVWLQLMVVLCIYTGWLGCVATPDGWGVATIDGCVVYLHSHLFSNVIKVLLLR